MSAIKQHQSTTEFIELKSLNLRILYINWRVFLEAQNNFVRFESFVNADDFTNIFQFGYLTKIFFIYFRI